MLRKYSGRRNDPWESKREKGHILREKSSVEQALYTVLMAGSCLTSADEFGELNWDEIMKGFESQGKRETVKQKGRLQE